MDQELIKNADIFYHQAEQKSSDYFKSLYTQVMEKTYVSTLTKDIQSWKKNHISKNPLETIISQVKLKRASKGYYNYIKWLDSRGKLESYLERSISYIFMRDLGKALDSPDIQKRIRRIVDSLKKQLTSNKAKQEEKNNTVSIASVYRKAQDESVELTMIWLIEKLKVVFANIPAGMDAKEAKRKLIKIIAGVIMHQIEEMDDDISSEKRTQKLDESIRLGYCYGLTYPFIDDLLDSKVLSDEEEKQYSDLIRTTLITGTVPELPEWSGSNAELIRYIHSELREAFEYIKKHQSEETKKTFFEQCYVFFKSQEVDRLKDISNANYTNEEIFIPIILKSSSSRLVTRSVLSVSEDQGFDNRTFFYGIYNQLADDFADMFDDMDRGAVTPYTYYIKYHKKRLDLINPFELYWTVISNLIHNVYHSDIKACNVILDRAINGLKRFKQKIGTEKYDEVMDILSLKDLQFNNLIQNMVKKANDVDFFDKLLRDQVITTLKNEQKEQEEFSNTIKDARKMINSILSIEKDQESSLIDDVIIDAANYSLEGDGKRMRPIIARCLGVKEYGLSETSIIPLLRSLEYFHTASLIFDDLPSQDNASTRRGNPTLHMVYNAYVAELTGLFLTQKANEQQASLDQFDSKTVLKLIKYSSQMTEDICKGQVMDLNSKGKKMTLEQLNMMCFYKTGKAFEASLIMPAMLANAKELEIETLKKFSYHAGIAFQIKDDLLDVYGDVNLLGKAAHKDTENNSSTFVSILGFECARKEMWEHYCLAIEALQDMPLKSTFLKHLLNYIVNRDH